MEDGTLRSPYLHMQQHHGACPLYTRFCSTSLLQRQVRRAGAPNPTMLHLCGRHPQPHRETLSCASGVGGGRADTSRSVWVWWRGSPSDRQERGGGAGVEGWISSSSTPSSRMRCGHSPRMGPLALKRAWTCGASEGGGDVRGSVDTSIPTHGAVPFTAGSSQARPRSFAYALSAPREGVRHAADRTLRIV